MKDSLIVAETFYSLQGEGVSAGKPAVFLRLAGCNLLCEGAGWRCDTIEVWKKGKHKKFNDVLSFEFLKAVAETGAHLVITGGEPMMQQHDVANYINYLKSILGFKPYVEIETNGTIRPSNLMKKLVDQWNVSFKLSSSGEPFEKRINDIALREFDAMPNAYFKIVISSEADVLELVNELVNEHPNISTRKIMLMPAGENQEQLEKTRPVVVEACKQFGYRYSDRLHIVIWNKKTGV